MPDIPELPSIETDEVPVLVDVEIDLDEQAAAAPPDAVQAEAEASTLLAAAAGQTPAPAAGLVSDSVEEVLQQASEQTLRLSHLEDVLGALSRNLSDLQDEMHAGFVELRVVAEQSGAQGGADPAADAFRRNAIERLDHLDLQLLRARRRQMGLLLVALLQAVLVIALGGYLYWADQHREPTFSSVPTYTAPAYQEPESKGSALQAPAADEPKVIKKGRKRRR